MSGGAVGWQLGGQDLSPAHSFAAHMGPDEPRGSLGDGDQHLGFLLELGG